MIKTRLRHALPGLAIAATTASLLLNIDGILHADLRPTIMSNTALVTATGSWLALAVLSIRKHVDKLRLTRELDHAAAASARPDLHLVPTPTPEPRTARFRLPAAAGPLAMLASLVALVALGVLAPRNTGAGATAPQQLPTPTPSTITVTVTPAAQANQPPGEAQRAQRIEPPTVSSTPTDASSATAMPTTTAPPAKKTKTRTPPPVTTTTGPAGPTGTSIVPTTQSQDDPGSAQAQTPPGAHKKAARTCVANVTDGR